MNFKKSVEDGSEDEDEKQAEAPGLTLDIKKSVEDGSVMPAITKQIERAATAFASLGSTPLASLIHTPQDFGNMFF